MTMDTLTVDRQAERLIWIADDLRAMAVHEAAGRGDVARTKLGAASGMAAHYLTMADLGDPQDGASTRLWAEQQARQNAYSAAYFAARQQLAALPRPELLDLLHDLSSPSDAALSALGLGGCKTPGPSAGRGSHGTASLPLAQRSESRGG